MKSFRTTFNQICNMLFIELKKALKNLVQELDVRKKTFRLSSHTPGYSLMSF